MNRLKLIAAFACFTQGWPLPAGVLDVIPVTSAVVDWPEETTFSADGEALVAGRRFELAVRLRSENVRLVARATRVRARRGPPRPRARVGLGMTAQRSRLP